MNAVTLAVDPHPRLELGVFVTEFAAPLGELETPAWLAQLLGAEAKAPLSRSEDVRQAVRRLLRHGGHKPTGRGKPASEYLVRASADGALSSINLAVDLCNAVSLASGLPISVVDLELLSLPVRVGLGAEGESYVFNPAGQQISLKGLLCLADAEGACANPVKDSQRTKTNSQTRRTLSVVWGSNELEPERLAHTLRWYRELCDQAGAQTLEVTV